MPSDLSLPERDAKISDIERRASCGKKPSWQEFSWLISELRSLSSALRSSETAREALQQEVWAAQRLAPPNAFGVFTMAALLDESAAAKAALEEAKKDAETSTAFVALLSGALKFADHAGFCLMLNDDDDNRNLRCTCGYDAWYNRLRSLIFAASSPEAEQPK